MTPIEFCYWLQGWVEMENGKKPNLEQWKMINSHLQLVFNKVTPPLGDNVEPTLTDDEANRSPQELLADLFTRELDTMSETLSEAVDQMNQEPPQVVFNPPRGDRPPQTPLCSDAPICSNVPDPRDLAFCCTAENESYKDRLPRKVHKD